ASVPKMVETALATSIPLLIGFLASLLGISGLANKVKSVFHTVAKPVNRAIGKIINFITKAGKKLWNKLKGKKNEKDKEKESKNKKSEEATETQKSKDVKREARRMLARHTDSPLANERELDSILSDVTAKLLPKGLKSLRAEKSDSNSAEINVIAKASPEERVASFVEPRIEQHLPQHGASLSKELKKYWWNSQLDQTKAWNDISVLDNFEDSAIDYLRQPTVHKNLEGYFKGGRQKDASTDAFKRYALHILNPDPNHSTRSAFYEKAGDSAVAKLKSGATAEVTGNTELNEKLQKLRFDSDRQYGRFSSLPTAQREVDPRLVAAAGKGRILAFLKEMATDGKSGDLDLSDLGKLWTEKGVGENPHRKWLKGEFRALAAGHHEWIPTDRLLNILDMDMGRSNTEESVGWIELQDDLRSLTTDVIWELRITDTMTEVESHDMDAHVGAFMTYEGNPIYNGRDKKWHDSLRGYFKDFVAQNENGKPSEFLKILRDLLEAGKLMWNGDTTHLTRKQKNLKILAIYKSLQIKSDRIGESAQREKPFTVEELGTAQEESFQRLRNKLDTLIEEYSKRSA
ncbi:hypothetical protein AB0467_26135, partial [Streptomyces sp. NPDC052095]